MDEQKFYREEIPAFREDAPQPYPYIPEKKKSRFGLIAIICSAALVTTGLIIVAILLFNNRSYKNGLLFSPEETQQQQQITDDTIILQESNRENISIDVEQIEVGELMTPAQVYAKCVESTVGITTSMTTTNYWGYTTTSAASGSGFILSENGYILTNHHVIEDSNSIRVSFYDGTTLSATLIGSDERSDIAILKVNASGLTPVVLGNSDNLYVGDNVAAIGNPLGELTFSLTTGIVSALNREITMSNGNTMNLIQTDCAINSGNSGGALFNLYGEVVGITNAKYSSSAISSSSIDNIAFAIPINDVRNIIESILSNGYVAKPYLGITTVDVSQQAQAYGLPAGASIQKIVSGSPAQEAGLKVNDIVTYIDGTAVTGSSHLISLLKRYSIGDEVKLTVYRQGQTLTITAVLGEQH